MERVAVLPMDIRIEAVLFAQTRSFFVIPGDWFNTSPDDNVAAWQTAANPTGVPRHYDGGTATDDTNRFPFYGQPIDLKITIDGAVSEARPANVAAQTAWMLKWGWIPQYHGNLIGLSGGTVEPPGIPTGSGFRSSTTRRRATRTTWETRPASPAVRRTTCGATSTGARSRSRRSCRSRRAAVCRPERRRADFAIGLCTRGLHVSHTQILRPGPAAVSC